MKQSPDDCVEQYAKLLRRYHAALDLLSNQALNDLDRLFADAALYAQVIERHRPPPSTVLDLGSGAGLPGIVIACRLPKVTMVLAERRRRRAAFLNLVVGQLGLENARVHADDVASLAGPEVDVVTAQAVGSLLSIYCQTRHLHAKSVLLVARKGVHFAAEVDELKAKLEPAWADFDATPTLAHGRLVAVNLPGGLPCPSLASSTKKGGSERQPPPST